MPAILANAQNFLTTTDYPLDKCVWIGSATHSFAGGTSVVIPHPLSFTPLIKVVWSTTPTFSTTYGVGDGVISSSTTTPFQPELTSAAANSSSVLLEYGNPGSVTTAYIRVYAFMPSNINVDSPYTSSDADLFVYNSDYNYSKLYMADLTASSSVASSTEVVNHNLGYYPQCEIWYEKASTIYTVKSTFIFNGSVTNEAFIMTPTTLTMVRDSFLSTPERFHYRIYLDKLA